MTATRQFALGTFASRRGNPFPGLVIDDAVLGCEPPLVTRHDNAQRCLRTGTATPSGWPNSRPREIGQRRASVTAAPAARPGAPDPVRRRQLPPARAPDRVLHISSWRVTNGREQSARRGRATVQAAPGLSRICSRDCRARSLAPATMSCCGGRDVPRLGARAGGRDRPRRRGTSPEDSDQLRGGLHDLQRHQRRGMFMHRPSSR